MKRLFGTDGIRGVAGEAPLDPPTVRRVGAAIADALRSEIGRPPRLIVGRDTRESGPWLRDAIAHGTAAHGGTVDDAGVITTPGLAYLAKHEPYEAGVMISASHNPFADNGLKIFSHAGFKLPDAVEADIEARVLDHGVADPGERACEIREVPSAAEHYLASLLEAGGGAGSFAGKRLIVDCANGAAHAIAPALFEKLGADLETLGCDPDGRNINLDCGSLYLDRLSDAVRSRRADLGIAYDGDADRCLMVDPKGRVVDGDYILYLMARGLKRAGRLRSNRVVATIMSNLWLETRLAEEGIELLRSKVGDKYVLEMMRSEGAVLGGEQSGHIILSDVATTGDGVLTSVALVRALENEDLSLDTLLDEVRPFPQVLINVPVGSKPDLRSHPDIGPAVAEAERALDGTGRVVLRYSGTERLARVMVEGKEESAVREHARRLAEAIRSAIGA